MADRSLTGRSSPRWWRARSTVGIAVSVLVLVVFGLFLPIEPHPNTTAAAWLVTVAGASQSVAVEGRDHHLAQEVDRVGLRRVQLPSSDSGPAEWCAALAGSDWVVLSAGRPWRTVRGESESDGGIARFDDLLFSGEAGFMPLTRARRGPRWLGLELPASWTEGNLLGDVVSQVIVFSRVKEVDPAELRRRFEARSGSGSGSEVDRSAADALPRIESIPGPIRQLRDVAVWISIMSVLGLACWVLILPLVAEQPDAGLGLALATGWVVPAWVMWLGSELGAWRIGPAEATGLFLVLMAIAACVARRRRALISGVWINHRRAMMLVAAVTLAVGIFFLAVRAVNPAIAGGEKPMDFSFLNAFVGADAWPTDEPWMAGRPLHYYYFGQVLAAFPILLCGCRAAVGFNLVAATVPALAAAVLTAVGLIAARGRRGGALLIPGLVLLSGNLAWPTLLAKTGAGGLFDLWWATSRVIPSPYAIEEFPLWTAIFADLHGHFIALPVLLTALLWGWTVVQSSVARWPAAAALCGISAGVLAATNPWDIMVFAAALGLGVLAAAPRPKEALVRLFAAAAVSLAAVAPFLVEMLAGIRAGAGGGRGLHPTTGDFAPWWALAIHFGLFLLPLAALAVARAGRTVWLSLGLASTAVVTAYLQGSSGAGLALVCAALFAGALLRTAELEQRLGWTLALLGALLVTGCEYLTVIDRMNTVFKIYNGAWVVLALALGILLLTETGRHRRLVFAVWMPLQVVAAANLPLGAVQAWADPLVPSPRPTLDGQAYLRHGRLDDWFLARTVEAVAAPGDTVAEAAGKGYSRAVRIVMHTGRPTVVGWPWHLQQRGQSKTDVETRNAALADLYGGDDPVARRAILDLYGISWIVVGNLERATYRIRLEDPFAGVPGVIRVTSKGRSGVYKVE